VTWCVRESCSMYSATDALLRPKPAEHSCSKECVDKSVYCRLDCDVPCAPVPDGHLPQRNRIPDECDRADELEYVHVHSTRRCRSPNYVCGERRNRQQIDEPLNEIPSHRHHAFRENSHDDVWTFCCFRCEFRASQILA